MGENITTHEDWYSINHMAFEDHNGIGLLAKYNDSPPSVVMEVLRDHVRKKIKKVNNS